MTGRQTEADEGLVAVDPPSHSPKPPTRAAAWMTRVPAEFAALVAVYGLVLAALTGRGINPRPPVVFLALIVFFVVPVAYLLSHAGRAIEDRARYSLATATPLMIAGLVMIGVYHFFIQQLLVVLIVFVAVAAAKHLRGGAELARPILIGGSVLFVGYGAVWGLNYLFASFTFDRIQDARLLQLDLAIYGLLAGTTVDPVGMFPLVRSPFLVQILENAYQLLFVQVFLLIFLLQSRGESFRPFLRSLFLCYFLGLLVFLVYPAVGPCIYMPETFRSSYHDTQTYVIMQGMYEEYRALRDGGALTGFGYFVAVPSLHVALAVLLQAFLYRSSVHFWVFLPVNILMILSTVVLGYHYIVDAPAGMALGAAVWVISRKYLGNDPDFRHVSA